MKKQLLHGILISLEGIDGSGKSSLARDLAQHCTQEGWETILTKEPGSTGLGQIIRTIVHEKKVPVDPQAEFLLFAADRAQHFTQVVMPALQNKKLVISDRMADSSLAYQGYGRGLDTNLITTVNHWAMQGKEPDIAFYIRVLPTVARERITKRNVALTSFEQEDSLFLERVYHGFETLFADKKNGIIINGEQPYQTVLHDTLQAIDSWINTQAMNKQ